MLFINSVLLVISLIMLPQAADDICAIVSKDI